MHAKASPSTRIAPPSPLLKSESDQITTLPNGLRIATEATPGHFSAVGVFVDAGSRYEDDETSGVSHIIDKLAYKSTTTRTQDDMIHEFELLGGTQMCSSTRESLMYTASVFNQDVDKVTNLLADTIINPMITEEEVQGQVQTAEYEIDDIWQKPEMILPELLHAAAYKETLGRPLLCPDERLAFINSALVKSYRSKYFVPERIVVGFVGVPHEEALHLGQKYFGHMHGQSSPKTIPSKYNGGSIFLPETALPNEEWTHLHVAFEAPSLSSPDIYAFATLQILLGGGGSFSAGGPGKGMYSRLYTNVLNQYGWIESCQSFNHTYADSGLFGISASSRNDASYAMAGVIAKELALLFDTGRKGITEVEASRARNQLRSSLLMNLESRMIVLEDLGRQVQALGKRIAAEEMCHHIDSLTVKDLRRVAASILTGSIGTGTGQASVVGAGKGVTKLGDVFGTLSRFGLGR